MTGLKNWALSLAGLGSLCWLGSMVGVGPEDLSARLCLLAAIFLAAGMVLSVLLVGVAAAGRIPNARRK